MEKKIEKNKCTNKNKNYSKWISDLVAQKPIIPIMLEVFVWASHLLSVLTGFDYDTSFVVSTNISNGIRKQLVFCIHIMLSTDGDPRNIFMRRVKTFSFLGYFMLILVSLRARVNLHETGWVEKIWNKLPRNAALNQGEINVPSLSANGTSNSKRSRFRYLAFKANEEIQVVLVV